MYYFRCHAVFGVEEIVTYKKRSSHHQKIKSAKIGIGIEQKSQYPEKKKGNKRAQIFSNLNEVAGKFITVKKE